MNSNSGTAMRPMAWQADTCCAGCGGQAADGCAAGVHLDAAHAQRRVAHVQHIDVDALQQPHRHLRPAAHFISLEGRSCSSDKLGIAKLLIAEPQVPAPGGSLRPRSSSRVADIRGRAAGAMIQRRAWLQTSMRAGLACAMTSFTTVLPTCGHSVFIRWLNHVSCTAARRMSGGIAAQPQQRLVLQPQRCAARLRPRSSSLSCGGALGQAWARTRAR